MSTIKKLAAALSCAMISLLSTSRPAFAVCYTSGECSGLYPANKTEVESGCKNYYFDPAGPAPRDEKPNGLFLLSCEKNKSGLGAPVSWPSGNSASTSKCGIEAKWFVSDWSFIRDNVYRESVFGYTVITKCAVWSPIIEFISTEKECAAQAIGSTCPEPIR